MVATEEQRASELLEAQAKAEALFHAVEARGLIRAGISENNLNAEIYALAQEMYGIRTYWHKRIVRAGKNTLLPYDENPPDLTIGEDDILFLDLGPVFEQWEADFGRTVSLSNGLDGSQCEGRLTVSFGWSHPSSEVVLCLHRQVHLHLFTKALITTAAKAEIPHAREKPVQDSHANPPPSLQKIAQ
jgi:Metallopeptidase family M24